MAKRPPAPSNKLIRFPGDIVEWLKAKSKRDGLSMNQIVIDATIDARTRELGYESDFAKAQERLITAFDAFPKDERWDALLDLLKYFELKPEVRRLVVIDDRQAKTELQRIASGYTKTSTLRSEKA